MNRANTRALTRIPPARLMAWIFPFERVREH